MLLPLFSAPKSVVLIDFESGVFITRPINVADCQNSWSAIQ